MKTIVGYVKNLNGRFMAESKDGTIRELRPNDPIYEGDAVYGKSGNHGGVRIGETMVRPVGTDDGSAAGVQADEAGNLQIFLNDGKQLNITEAGYLLFDSAVMGKDFDFVQVGTEGRGDTPDDGRQDRGDRNTNTPDDRHGRSDGDRDGQAPDPHQDAPGSEQPEKGPGQDSGPDTGLSGLSPFNPIDPLVPPPDFSFRKTRSGFFRRVCLKLRSLRSSFRAVPEPIRRRKSTFPRPLLPLR